jgi:hypothetical protein
MDWADDKLDVLQNLEFSVVQVWRAHPEMTDYSALRAYETAFQAYRAELRGQTPKAAGLSGLDGEVLAAVRAICEFRLGRGPAPVPGPDDIPPIELELLVDCLRELGKSVERHTKDGGRQGYLNFVAQYLP